MDNSTEGEDHLVTAVVTMEEEEEGDGLIREVTRSVNATGGETTEMEQDVYYGGKALQANATVCFNIHYHLELPILLFRLQMSQISLSSSTTSTRHTCWELRAYRRCGQHLANQRSNVVWILIVLCLTRGVSLTVRRGEFICIFGTSGGGKTTLLNIMGTIDKPTKGEMHVAGVRKCITDMHSFSCHSCDLLRLSQGINSSTEDKDLSRLRRSHIGFVFQTFNLLSSLTALENVEVFLE